MRHLSTYWRIQQVASWCNIPCVSPCQIKLQSPTQISVWVKTRLLPPLVLYHHPSQVWEGVGGWKEADSHKCSSSPPDSFGCGVIAAMCNLLQPTFLLRGSRLANPLKHEINRSQGVWLIHTQGTRHHPDLIMKRFQRVFNLQIDFSASFSKVRIVRSGKSPGGKWCLIHSSCCWWGSWNCCSVMTKTMQVYGR